MTLDRPLPLAAGARVRFRIEAGVGDGPPVALWLYPAPSGLPPLRIRDAAGERRVPATTPRLTLGLRR